MISPVDQSPSSQKHKKSKKLAQVECMQTAAEDTDLDDQQIQALCNTTLDDIQSADAADDQNDDTEDQVADETEDATENLDEQ